MPELNTGSTRVLARRRVPLRHRTKCWRRSDSLRLAFSASHTLGILFLEGGYKGQRKEIKEKTMAANRE